MPAIRVNGTAVSLRPYDVVGLDSTTRRQFVQHVALADFNGDALSRVAIVHMGPPLERGVVGGSPIQTVGTCELTVDEIRQIGVFIDELSSEYDAAKLHDGRQQYIIHPHVSEPDQVHPCRRFSCAGFVLEAYRDAGIEILTTANVPVVDLDTLCDAYPHVASILRNEKFRSNFGLTEANRVDGGWRVILAGYVVNAFARETEEIREQPYQAVEGDAFFPSTPSQTSRSVPLD